MTAENMTANVRARVGDNSLTDNLISVYLGDAADAIMKRLYPFGTSETEVPEKYHVTQCKLAARYILRRGGEGEISHSENGVARSYGSVDDADILNTIVPYAKVGKSHEVS